MAVTYWANLHSQGGGHPGEVGRLVYRGAYSSGGHYYPGDVVNLSGTNYVALAQRLAGGSAPGTDAAVWATIADVLGTVALPEPPAQPPLNPGSSRLYGPYVVDYTDIPHDGDKMTLWVPQVGDVLLRLFCDWQNVTQWDSGTLFIGQNVDGTVDTPVAIRAKALASYIDSNSGNGGLDSVTDAATGAATNQSGSPLGNTATVFHTTDPVQIQLALTGGTDPGAGHVDIYALVARAVAP